MEARARRGFAFIERLTSGRWGLVRLSAIVLVLLGSTALQGLQIDDFWLRAFVRGHPRWVPEPRPWWGIFTFFSGDPRDMIAFRSEGIAPWWADDHTRIIFFRPLAGLTHTIDFTLWPGAPALMHLHSLAWYVAMVIAAALLFRRLLPPAAAGLAALLYAIDYTHGGVVGWVANRNAVIAGAFALTAILFHDRAVRGEVRARYLAALCTALALCAGESGLGAVAYLAAHALTLDDRPLRARVKDLLPHAAVFLAWVTVYRLGGFGARGSAAYLDPGRSPLQFLAQLPTHGALLLAGEWGSLPPEVELLMRAPLRPLLLLAAFLAVAASLFAITARLRASRTARFFVLGAFLAVVPGCATLPALRLMLLSGFGLLGVLAELMIAAVDPAAEALRGARALLVRWFAIWVGGAHLVLSPILMVPMSWQIVVLQDQLLGFARSFPPDDAALPSQRLVLVTVIDPVFAGYLLILRDGHGMTVPRGLLQMAVGTRPVELRRVSDDAVEVTAPGGFLQWLIDYLVRDRNAPMPAGTRVVMDDVTIDVLHTTPAGVPDVARFTFAGGVDSPRFRWVKWEDRRYVPFTLPPIGGSVTLQARAPGT